MGELLDARKHRSIDWLRYERRELAKVLRPQLVQRLRGRHRADLLGARCTSVMVGHRPGHGAQAWRHVATLPDQRRQPPVGREPAHQDCAVDDVAGVVDDILDAEVDVRAEAPVQGHVSLTGLPAQLPGAEVDEGEAHRLLAFVHPFAIEHQRRHVRLDGLHACDVKGRGRAARLWPSSAEADVCPQTSGRSGHELVSTTLRAPVSDARAKTS